MTTLTTMTQCIRRTWTRRISAATRGTVLRSALLALLALAVISGGGLAAGDLFDNDYSDCPHRTRLREGQIADLTAARDAEEGDVVNVAWTTTDPATWGLGPNTYNTSLVVVLDDGDDLDTMTLSLGTGKAAFTDVRLDADVKVQMAIVADTPNGDYLISDILEASVNPNLPAPSFKTRLWTNHLVGNSIFYFVGYNENFGNYRAAELTTRPSTARLRIGLAHGHRETVLNVSELLELITADVPRLDDADFDGYVVRITDESGDVIPGGDDVVTVSSNYDDKRLIFGIANSLQNSSLPDNDRVLSNVRINDGGKISAAMQNLSSLPFTADPTISPGNQGLAFVEVDFPSATIGSFSVIAIPPDEHRDFPIDMLASDETYKVTAWAVNDRGEVISTTASLAVRPIDKKANIGTITDYANASGTAVTNVYVTDFTVYK